MFKKKMEDRPVKYYYLSRHHPYYFSNVIKRFFKMWFIVSNDIIDVELDDFYTNRAKLRDDIVSYVRNERHLYCEAIDDDHFMIDGKRYILNVSLGGETIQNFTLYREDIYVENA